MEGVVAGHRTPEPADEPTERLAAVVAVVTAVRRRAATSA